MLALGSVFAAAPVSASPRAASHAAGKTVNSTSWSGYVVIAAKKKRFRYVAAEGGLASYGVDIADQYRRAAGYVDKILRGKKPRELPVQAPNKYELVINLKTAKTLGLTIPSGVLAIADEVIE